MVEREAMSVEELSAMVLAINNMMRVEAAQMHARVKEHASRVLGVEKQEQSAEEAEFEARSFKWVSDLLARRLKRNDRAVPLVSREDIVSLITAGVAFAVDGSSKLDITEHLAQAVFAEAAAERFHDAFLAMLPPGEDPYESWWRLITIVLDLAAERSVSPIEVLSLPEVGDEIKRRMYSREQFVAFRRHAMRANLDADRLKKLSAGPMLEVLAKLDPEAHQAMSRKVDEKLMPKLRELVATVEPILNDFVNEEVARVYGSV